MSTDALASLPTELGWGLVVALLVRGLLAYAPRIVDAISRALTERSTAHRLSEQARLTEAETEQADHAELRRMRDRIDALEQRLREQEHACGQEIEAQLAMHRITADKLASLEAQHSQCTSRVAALAAELAALRTEIASGNSPH